MFAHLSNAAENHKMLHHTILPASLVLSTCLAALSCAGGLRPQADSQQLSAEQLLRLKAEILRAEDLALADEAVLRAIESRNSELKTMAARAMGRIADPSFRPLLEERCLEDREASVRAEAAFALGLLGDSSALPILSKASSDRSPAVRKSAAAALGLLHDAASDREILTLLEDPEPEVVAAACYTLPLLDSSDFALDQLLKLIDERGSEVGMAALRALAWLASDPTKLGFEERKRAREHLTAFADSRLAEARNYAAIGLAIPMAMEEAELLGRLIEEDPNPMVRFSAIRSLSFPGAPVEPFVSKALESEYDLVALAAVQGIGAMKGPEAVEALARFIIHDSRTWLRELAIAMAGRVSPTRAAAMANGLSRDSVAELREAAARLLVGRTDPGSLAIAERLVEDQEPAVRAAAIPALAGGEGKLSELLGSALRDEDPSIRAAVAEAAGRRLADSQRSAEDRGDALEILQQLWDSSAEAHDAALRLAVMEAAARAGAEPEVRILVEEGLRSPDRQLRRTARAHHRALFGEEKPEGDSLEATAPLADYIEILRWTEKPHAAVITVERPGFTPGKFTVELDTDGAPLTSWNFARLAESRFYDGREIEWVAPGLVVRSSGEHGTDYRFRSEISPSLFDSGTLGLIPSAKDYSSSRWFISLSTQPLLGAAHTAFGRVVQNFPGVVFLLLPGDRIVSVEVYEGDGSEELQ
jgi:HEAT repeat protein/cyclophilin family peptidyl-prolyl cis-trans isomerase